jgi:hypothetical protein
MIDWYLSLNLGIQVLIGVMAFLVGQIIIVFLFSLLQLLFVKWFRRSDE